MEPLILLRTRVVQACGITRFVEAGVGTVVETLAVPESQVARQLILDMHRW